MPVLDLTATPTGEWSSFLFPDGQPHVSMKMHPHDVRRIYARITNSNDLVNLLLIRSMLPHSPDLTLSYLMGGRMDRPMPRDERGQHPFTLNVIAKVIRDAGWRSIRLFDPHSDVSTALLNAEAILPYPQVLEARERSRADVLIAPDAGASKRVEHLGSMMSIPVVQALKKRDPTTGKLSGFRLVEPESVEGKRCLIVDDILDGGRTFTGLAMLLQEAGAVQTTLYVSHGIFSAGYNIGGISHIFTTDSLAPLTVVSGFIPDFITTLDWRIASRYSGLRHGA